MNRFSEVQSKLDALLPVPTDLPRVYLLGDTGTGKTSLIRQILGTEKYKFPSVRRKRTTVAVTEYVVTDGGAYKAVVVLKSPEEISNNIREILEDTLYKAYRAERKNRLDIQDVMENLEESPDERFRLRYIIPEDKRRTYAATLIKDFLPSINSWIQDNFPNEEDIEEVFELALHEAIDGALSDLESEILAFVEDRVKLVTGVKLKDGILVVEESDLAVFIDRLKLVLASEPGSVSPAVARARIRGDMRAPWLSDAPAELVLIDGEGIGHDTREDKTLASRHLDYFYLADEILLVEDAEKPFTGGGKAAISGIVRNGYLPRFHVCFCRLDRVDKTEREGRVREVNKGLRNVLNALSEEDIALDRADLNIWYVGDLNQETPDNESIADIKGLLAHAQAKAARTREHFVSPQYDYELISAFLDHATREFRDLWSDYLFGCRDPKKPWQTVKAFNRRMVRREDGYQAMQPVSELHSETVKRLNAFFSSPSRWNEEVTSRLQSSSLDCLKQEFGQLLLEFIRQTIVANNHTAWNASLGLSGRGSTYERALKIERIITEAAPPLTEPHAGWIKNQIKELINQAMIECAKASQRNAT